MKRLKTIIKSPWERQLNDLNRIAKIDQCYPCPSKMNLDSMIEERKNESKKEMIHCHLTYGYFVVVNQIVITSVEYLSKP